MSSDAPVTFLTQDAYDRLVAELEHLSTTGREEIAKLDAEIAEGLDNIERLLPQV